MIKYCCFICPKDPIAEALVLWPEFCSDEYGMWQALIFYVNDKTPSLQEEIEPAPWWMKQLSPMFSLKRQEGGPSVKPGDPFIMPALYYVPQGGGQEKQGVAVGQSGEV